MTLKVVFEKGTYRLLGAQIVGYEGVDKRIDVLATAIHAEMCIRDRGPVGLIEFVMGGDAAAAAEENSENLAEES